MRLSEEVVVPQRLWLDELERASLFAESLMSVIGRFHLGHDNH
jgi:hypothetical protein